MVDPAGNLYGHFLDATIPESNGAWLDEHRLLLAGCDDRWDLKIVDVTTGSHHIVGSTGQIPLAVIGDRIVLHVPGTVGGPARLETTAFDGSDPQPLITISNAAQIHGIDIVPSMWA